MSEQKAVVKSMAMPLPSAVKLVSFYFPALNKSAVNPYSYEIDAQDQITLKYSFTGITIKGTLLGREVVPFEGKPVLVYKIEPKEVSLVEVLEKIELALKKASEDKREAVEPVAEKKVEAVAPVKKKASKAKKK